MKINEKKILIVSFHHIKKKNVAFSAFTFVMYIMLTEF